jgi:hypothetical protein
MPLQFTMRSLILFVLFLLMALASGKLAFDSLVTRAHILHAEEQVQIFSEMNAKAERSPPFEGARCLRYVRDYYPSGTKHSAGSPLDTIVETTRALAIQQIIGDLRRKTGEDLGNDAEAWIRKFGEMGDTSDVPDEDVRSRTPPG